MKKYIVTMPTITTNEFWKRLQKRPFEDVSVIRMVEKHFLKTRGYVFQMPKPNSPVVLLLSGGLDSTIAWSILMHVYHLHVYPLCVGKANREYLSIRSIAKIYERQCPEYFHTPRILKGSMIPDEFSKFLRTSTMHPNQLLNRFNLETSDIEVDTLNGTNSLSLISGYLYAQILELHKNIHINTVFCGVLSIDGITVRSQTLTFSRLLMMTMSQFSGNRHFQYSSVFFEKEIRRWMDKYEAIKLASVLKAPVDKTYSCFRNGRFHCGECSSCQYRHFSFEKSGIPDRTLYWKPHESLQYHCCILLKFFFQRVYTYLQRCKEAFLHSRSEI